MLMLSTFERNKSRASLHFGKKIQRGEVWVRPYTQGWYSKDISNVK